MTISTRRNFALLAAALAVLVSGCSTWTPVHRSSDWTLFVKDGARIDVARFNETLDPAFATVKERMGPFKEAVRVHAWDGDVEIGRGGSLSEGKSGDMEDVPGIGPARVRAFHVRGGSQLFSPSGVFLGVPDVGTAVHELVHARLSELDVDVPLWFEEGLASFYGDGALVGGRWVVDGLACWPLRELREQDLGDDELRTLLSIRAGDRYDARENLLVHFVGWAVVFDLAREEPAGTWRDWFDEFRARARANGNLAEARRRMNRTLSLETHVQWLERLDDQDPGVRIAAAKGTWKLHSRSAVDALLDRLEVEEDPSVRFALALNCMLATSELRLGRDRWWRLRRLVFPVLREPELESPDEQAAGESLYLALRRWDNRRRDDVHDAIAALAHYWEE